MDDHNSLGREDTRPALHTLRDFVAIIFRRRRLVTFTFLGVFLVGALFALDELIDEIYEGRIRLLIKKERIDAMLTPESNLQQRIGDLTEDELNSEVQLIQSRDVLEKVVDTWALDQPPGW